MIDLLKQIVTYMELHKDPHALVMVTHARFMVDFGCWRRGQLCEMLQVIVIERHGFKEVWLEEYCAALCVKSVQITLGVVA